MSRRTRRWRLNAGQSTGSPLAIGGTVLFGAMALHAGLALDVRAQTYESQESLVARIEALGPLVEEARLEAEAAAVVTETRARARAEAMTALDTFTVAEITVIAPVADAERGREVFEAAWRRHFDGVESAALRASVFMFQSGDEVIPIFVDDDAYTRHIRLEWWQTREDAVAIVASAITHAIRRDLGESRFMQWSASDPFVDHDPADIYRMTATIPSRSVRDCLAGAVDECSASLGLVEGATLDAWYTVEEARALTLRTFGSLGAREEGLARFPSCVDGTDPSACLAFLESQQGRDFTPLHGVVRGSVVGYALRLGGNGAWVRLVEARDRPVDEALAHTAGVSVDQLVGEWRAWVVAGRPAVHGSLASRSVFAMMWIVLFAALAMRSTRWRLG